VIATTIAAHRLVNTMTTTIDTAITRASLRPVVTRRFALPSTEAQLR
jgi:hypothetical protein